MEGFLSTSLSERSISNFIENFVMEIKIVKKNLGGELDNGFVDVSSISEFPSEKEVLFNAINMFKVIAVNWEMRKIIFDENNDKFNEDKEVWMIKLEYCPIRPLLERKRNH